jgi:hypothetical protein
MTKLRSVGVAVVFLVGCAVGGVSSQLVVPKASAQQAATLTRWQYLCPKAVDFEAWNVEANRAGEQGWELVSVQLIGGTFYPCFKRPKL